MGGDGQARLPFWTEHKDVTTDLLAIAGVSIAQGNTNLGSSPRVRRLDHPAPISWPLRGNPRPSAGMGLSLSPVATS